MANRLKMAQIQAVTALLQQGWSQRRIARELGLDRETVARYAQLAAKPANLRPGSDAPPEPKPANLRPGSEASEEAKPATLRPGSESVADAQDPLLAGLPNGALMAPSGASAGGHSACWPLREVIQRKLDQALSAQRIWQDLRTEHGFTASYYSVLRFVAKLRPDAELPFRRMECAPGAEAQVDFGTGAAIVDADGKRQRTYVFRIVLSHSRKAYSEAITRQTTDAFLACLENAFHHFGGAPRTLVIDNLKAAVTKADWFDPEINPKVLSFCDHHGIALLPTKPYMPRHKGKVERGIDYVQENALKGRTFASLKEQNDYLLDWERTVADTRIHGTTRRQVGAVFEQIEKPALLALPRERFANFQEGQRVVHRDGHVEISRAYYSVPPEYLGRTVWVRWDNRMVRVFNQRFELIATHIRHGPGGFSTLDAHLHSAKISRVERGAQELIDRAKALGPSIGQWAEALHQQRGVTGVRPILGLLGLVKKFPVPILDDACAAAHRHGAYRLRTVRQLAQNRLDAAVEETELLDAHPLIRPLTEYSQVVIVAAWDPGLGAGEPAAPVSPAPKPPPPPSLFPVRDAPDRAAPPSIDPAPDASLCLDS
jgi:transposase